MLSHQVWVWAWVVSANSLAGLLMNLLLDTAVHRDSVSILLTYGVLEIFDAR